MRSHAMTSEGSPYARFKRSLASGNGALVRAAAAELPRISLEDALAVCLVLRDSEPEVFERALVRYPVGGACVLYSAAQAIRALVRAQDPVSFRAVARLAECSPDFLYRTPDLRSRIEALRAAPRRAASPHPGTQPTSGVVRELAAQLTDEKRRRREEVAALQAALALAHRELLELRRQQAYHGVEGSSFGHYPQPK